MEIVKTKSFELAVNTAGDPKAERLAILTPGRLDTKDYAHNVSHVKFLADKGFFAVSFDAPGIWDSPGDISIYKTSNCMKAINELIEHYGNRPTLLMGHSRGGTISMLVGPQNEHVTHMVAVNSSSGGPSNIDRAAVGKDTVSYRDLPPGSERTPQDQRRRFDLPYSYFEDGDQFDALDGLSKSKKPKLFFYGDQDDLTTKDDVQNMYDKSADPKVIHELHTEHDYRLHPEIINEVNQTLAEFLRRYP